MVAATLHMADRDKDLQKNVEPHSTELHILQSKNPEIRRDEQVEPISLGRYGDLSRSHLKPLLDALENGDIELAIALTPSSMRLCGYQVASEEFEFYGGGENGTDVWTVSIPPGIYPVFAKKFVYDEVKDQYTNELVGYPGILCWYEGRVTHDPLRKDDIGSARIVFSNPYGHELARAILHPSEWNLYHEIPQHIHLIYPFEARELPFEFNGHTITKHGIVDSSLPEYLPKGIDPINLRNGGADLSNGAKSIRNLLEDAARRSGGKVNDPHMVREENVMCR